MAKAHRRRGQRSGFGDRRWRKQQNWSTWAPTDRPKISQIEPADPATPKQLAYLRALGHKPKPGLTKPKASRIIYAILQDRERARSNRRPTGAEAESDSSQ